MRVQNERLNTGLDGRELQNLPSRYPFDGEVEVQVQVEMSEFEAVEVGRRRDVHRATVRQTAAALARLAGHRQHFPTTAQRRPLQLGHRKVWRVNTRYRQTLKAHGGLRDKCTSDRVCYIVALVQGAVEAGQSAKQETEREKWR